MIKAKFGDHLHSKTDTAPVNEAPSKILAHILCCLILSTYELGIVPVFWEDAEDETDSATPADADPMASELDQLMSIFAWV